MTANLSDDLKKIILAGIGAAALTTEKAKQMIDEFVKKGELTVEQGKVLNEELKHNISRKIRENAAPQSVEEIAKAVAGLTPEERTALKAKIAEAEAARPTEANRQTDAARQTGTAPQENAGA